MKAVALAALAIALAGTAAQAVTYDPAAEFSVAGNPNGNYTYGYAASLGGALTPYTVSGTNVFGVYSAWQSTVDTFLGVYRFNSNNTLILHPSYFGLISVLRFTAPTTGTYAINGSFANGDNASTDVHVLLNGVSAFDGTIGTTAPFALSQSLTAGSTIDFAVGFGSNGNYFNDSTFLAASISVVPEPATWTLLIGGFAMTGGALRRRARGVVA